MLYFSRSRAIWVFCTAVMLHACGGGGSGSGSDSGGNTTPPPAPPQSITYEVKGIASKGPLASATVVAYGVQNNVRGAELARTGSTVDGSYSLTLSDYVGPVVLRVQSGSYVDEATTQSTSLSTSMNSVTIVNGNTVAHVTPLTEIAYRLTDSAISTETVNNANATVQAAFFGDESNVNILTTEPVNTGEAAATGPAADYGLMLAAISQIQANRSNLGVNSSLRNLIDDFEADLSGGALSPDIAVETAQAATQFITSPNNKTGVAIEDTTIHRALVSTINLVNPTAPAPFPSSVISQQRTINTDALSEGTVLTETRVANHIDAKPEYRVSAITSPAIFDINPANGSVSMKIDATEPGNHRARISAVNISGAQHYELSLSILADTTPPTITTMPEPGQFSSKQSVKLGTEGGASIYYTVDDSEPSTQSPQYTDPIVLSRTTTIKALAVDSADNASAVRTLKYTIDTVAPEVTATPIGGSFNVNQSVSLSTEVGADIYYTTTGRQPDGNSNLYTTPIVIDATTALMFFARDAVGNSSAIVTQNYIIDRQAPTVRASPPGGLYNAAQTIGLQSNEAATIFYTTDDTAPSTSSLQYTDPLNINTTTTLRFFAQDTANNRGAAQKVVYTVDTDPPETSANPPGGEYSQAQTVTLSTDADATIYFSTDGSEPTTESEQFSSQLQISETTTLKYFARDQAGNSEVVKTQTYVIDSGQPFVQISDNVEGVLPRNGTVVFSLAFSEPVTGFTADDIQIINGIKGEFTGNGTNYTLSVTAPNSGMGEIMVTVPASAAHNTHGEGNFEAKEVQSFDAEPPSISALQVSNDNVVNSSDSITSVAFSGVVLGAAQEPVTITIERVQGIAIVGSDNTFNGIVNLTSVDDALDVSATANVSDEAGNPSLPLQINFRKDTEPPAWITHPNIIGTSDNPVHNNDAANAPSLWSLASDGQTADADLEFKISNLSSIADGFGLSIEDDSVSSDSYQARSATSEIHVHPQPEDTFAGTTTVQLQARDSAGNESDPATFQLQIQAGEDASDPLHQHQWHLANIGQTNFASSPGAAGTDLSLQSTIESGILGDEVIVAVVDTGLEIAHEDLAANIVAGGSRDFVSNDTDPTNPATEGDHGTSVAGLIASRGWNGVGGRGVAPNAALKGFNFLLNQLEANELSSLGGAEFSADVSVFNQSYGFSNTDDFQIDSTIESQYLHSVTNLRNRKGAIFVKSAGNGFNRIGDSVTCNQGLSCQNANMDPTNTLPYNIVVAALAADGKKTSYSTAGAAVWISGFGGEFGVNNPAMMTTDQSGCSRGYVRSGGNALNAFNDGNTPHAENPNCNYTSTFNGTSSAAPTISGIAALLLDANPDLTWRDIKHILATTATQVDSAIASTVIQINGADYEAEPSWTTNQAGHAFHNYYGFGLANTNAAVTAAESYVLGSLGELTTTAWQSSSGLNLRIPDNSAGGITHTISDNNGLIIEGVQIRVNISHTFTGELAIELTSPSGTRSVLFNTHNGFRSSDNLTNMVLLTNAFYGEASSGSWQLRIIDAAQQDTGVLQDWSLRIFGHE